MENTVETSSESNFHEILILHFLLHFADASSFFLPSRAMDWPSTLFAPFLSPLLLQTCLPVYFLILQSIRSPNSKSASGLGLCLVCLSCLLMFICSCSFRHWRRNYVVVAADLTAVAFSDCQARFLAKYLLIFVVVLQQTGSPSSVNEMFCFTSLQNFCLSRLFKHPNLLLSNCKLLKQSCPCNAARIENTPFFPKLFPYKNTLATL